jgi:hypothetical protein
MATKSTNNYSDPTPNMLTDKVWLAIWEEIKTWDINVPSEYNGYTGATGNHVSAIYLAIANILEQDLKEIINDNKIKKRV